ncbi:unnamed protein product [Closterium sp. Yama58-4]|nr:unnamed protein product [Closterium sp. Yama58-4]
MQQCGTGSGSSIKTLTGVSRARGQRAPLTHCATCAPLTPSSPPSLTLPRLLHPTPPPPPLVHPTGSRGGISRRSSINTLISISAGYGASAVPHALQRRHTRPHGEDLSLPHLQQGRKGNSKGGAAAAGADAGPAGSGAGSGSRASGPVLPPHKFTPHDVVAIRANKAEGAQAAIAQGVVYRVREGLDATVRIEKVANDVTYKCRC